jgi:two-component system, cell cycle response regulator DivK
MSDELIFIVEDDPASLKLVKIVLADEGYAVESAVDSETALREIERFAPRLVLTDVHLPGMDGLELTRRLKTGERTKDIVVLALTADSTKEDEERILRAGCDGFVPKPVDIEALVRTVASFLQNGNRIG